MKKISSFILGLLIICGGLTVANASVDIPLVGGEVLPNGKLSVDATKLLPEVTYEIHCAINVPVATVMHFSIGGVFVYDDTEAFINGKDIGSISLDGQNGSLSAGNNELVLPAYKITLNRGGALLEFTNLDNAITAQVSNCIARPV